jgi:hypothetical protein
MTEGVPTVRTKVRNILPFFIAAGKNFLPWVMGTGCLNDLKVHHSHL